MAWTQTVKIGHIWKDETLGWQEIRDAVIPHLRRLKGDDFGNLEDIIDELAETTTVGEFDTVWGFLYDYADAERIWIDVF